MSHDIEQMTPDAPPIRSVGSTDVERFVEAVRRLGAEHRQAADRTDVRHLRRLERFGRASTALGVARLVTRPGPVATLLLANGNACRWMLMHHISHRAYDRIDGLPGRLHSTRFAQGWRRFVDWPDWIHPEAWHVEHDLTHHRRMGEPDDPDVLERNIQYLNDRDVGRGRRLMLTIVLMATWKWSYFAPKTMAVLDQRRRGGRPRDAPTIAQALDPRGPLGRETWTRSLLPYLVIQFVGVAVGSGLLGSRRYGAAAAAMVGADILTNVHSFVMIVPNHAAEDLGRFNDRPADRGEAMTRQLRGTVDYTHGGDALDYLHMWLNYHIEHHLWPDLTLVQYRRIQPRLERLCRDHGLPYHQGNVIQRLTRTMRILLDTESPESDPHSRLLLS